MKKIGAGVIEFPASRADQVRHRIRAGKCGGCGKNPLAGAVMPLWKHGKLFLVAIVRSILRCERCLEKYGVKRTRPYLIVAEARKVV